MKIIISFTSKNKKLDVMVNRKQRIIDTTIILEEKGYLSNVEKGYIRLNRNQRMYLMDLTYEEAEIYNGDELLLENKM